MSLKFYLMRYTENTSYFIVDSENRFGRQGESIEDAVKQYCSSRTTKWMKDARIDIYGNWETAFNTLPNVQNGLLERLCTFKNVADLQKRFPEMFL